MYLFKNGPSCIILFSLILISCSNSETARIEGDMDYVGSSDIYIEKRPIHYKYAPVSRLPVHPDDEGAFQLDIPVDSTEIVFFVIDDTQYPLVLEQGSALTVSIRRAHFPDSVSVTGYPVDWDDAYTDFINRDRRIMETINRELPAFREGESSRVLELYRSRIPLAREYLEGTPLEIYYHKAIGEYLVKRLEYITYNRTDSDFNPAREREEVLTLAQEMNFFTFEVLRNQRAGIRDFTNAYANTFGVEEQIEEAYGQELMQYDVKRLGYATLDSARTSVLDHIQDRRALAYSKMHLIAERIGEMSPEVAETSYRNFLEEYREFPAYTSFLEQFFEEVSSVSPGEPAVPFSLPSSSGEIRTMADFRGKFVLLDFWAVWCIPCLDEFPHMNRLYDKYSRDDFEIVAISTEEDSLTWRQALNRFQNPWVQLYGGDGFDQETFNSYRGGGIPFYILIDRQGNIERYNDIRPSFNLEAVLDSLLASENRN